VQLAPARQVFSVLGGQAAGGRGYEYGLNEHQVAVSGVALPGRTPVETGLIGPQLVRLTLERSASARQAADFLTDVLDRLRESGQTQDGDYAFSIADPREAYVVETADCHWAYQEPREVRATSGVRIIRQDWDRISHGLAGQAIEQGLWPADGSKVDFSAVLPSDVPVRVEALRRWSRATVLLQEQNGHIDAGFIRQILRDHDDAGGLSSGALCRHNRSANETTVASMIATLDQRPDSLAWARCAFGPPCRCVHFSLFLDGEIPEAFLTGDNRSIFSLAIDCLEPPVPGRRERVELALQASVRLQENIDRETEEFLTEARRLKTEGWKDDLRRQATTFMKHQLEQFEAGVGDALRARPSVRPPFLKLRRSTQQEESSAVLAGYFG
jgi:hypothetical protein